ncbi:hypothetical protein SLEP1_g44625 [Rubroshorea leprosula]|uniref:Uncharacterized protein n=1 Tax=Rubroshorea leprosula TaxID=152421 RepID=A0AAV5LGT1_9ROSI|nr:hypothetical protein SLEP1_g44625 [Rubroshorea leprosula]
MLQCIEGIKRLFASLLRCCDIGLYKQSRGLEDPELPARGSFATLYTCAEVFRIRKWLKGMERFDVQEISCCSA